MTVLREPSVSQPATAEQVRAVFGRLDDAKLLEVLGLGATVADLEEASAWLAADRDIFGPRVLGATADAVVAVLTAEEDDPPG